jgi:hypothetical protein
MAGAVEGERLKRVRLVSAGGLEEVARHRFGRMDAGASANYGRWRRKRLSGRRRRGKSPKARGKGGVCRGLLAVVQASEGLRRGKAGMGETGREVLRRLAAEEKVSSLAPIRRRSL